MFFILSKIFYFLIKPFNWILLGLLFSFLTHNPYQRKRWLKYTLFVGLFFSSPLLFNAVAKWWETPAVAMQSIENHDVAIILGGFTRTGLHRVDDRYVASAANPRLTTAIELYKLGKVKKILITSGDGAIFRLFAEPEADLAKAFLLRVGIPESDILIENQSKNTSENAKFTKKILDEKYPNAKCLLITSASHLPRSADCFAKTGFVCTPFATDHKAERITNEPRTWLTPDPEYLLFWQFMIKEWIGIVVYKVVGYA
jgi:uncharacterized SAM-binding protein YcdF (DUF218 family)